MLALTRRIGEELVIDGGIRVVVVGVLGGQVRLGVIAPNAVRVDRGEVNTRRVLDQRPEPTGEKCAGA
ncbi:MAG TPA: carbon storage regulator [Gemmata sp.]